MWFPFGCVWFGLCRRQPADYCCVREKTRALRTAYVCFLFGSPIFASRDRRSPVPVELIQVMLLGQVMAPAFLCDTGSAGKAKENEARATMTCSRSSGFSVSGALFVQPSWSVASPVDLVTFIVLSVSSSPQSPEVAHIPQSRELVLNSVPKQYRHKVGRLASIYQIHTRWSVCTPERICNRYLNRCVAHFAGHGFLIGGIAGNGRRINAVFLSFEQVGFIVFSRLISV